MIIGLNDKLQGIKLGFRSIARYLALDPAVTASEVKIADVPRMGAAFLTQERPKYCHR